MAHISFTHIIEFDQQRYIEKYIVPEHKVPEDFVREFMRGDTYIVQYVIRLWKEDETVYKLSTDNSIHATGACLLMPRYMFIEKDYVCFL
jgi:hypothetical protein